MIWRTYVTVTLCIRTSGQSNLTKGCIAAAHGRFSVVFASRRQCAPHLVHHSRHPHRTGSAPCWVALSIRPPEMSGHVRSRPPFSLLAPSRVGIGTPSDTSFLRPTRVHTQTASWSVQPFLQVSPLWQIDRQKCHATPSAVLCRIAMGPNKKYCDSYCNIFAIISRIGPEVICKYRTEFSNVITSAFSANLQR